LCGARRQRTAGKHSEFIGIGAPTPSQPPNTRCIGWRKPEAQKEQEEEVPQLARAVSEEGVDKERHHTNKALAPTGDGASSHLGPLQSLVAGSKAVDGPGVAVGAGAHS
jgi:hypothetical protein